MAETKLSRKRRLIMGNRYSERADMVGLTIAEKKQIWNREYNERKRQELGYRNAAGQAAGDSFRYRRVIRPVGVIGNPPDDIWWETNDKSFRRGLAAASQRRDG